jgi:hypothetical protein
MLFIAVRYACFNPRGANGFGRDFIGLSRDISREITAVICRFEVAISHIILSPHPNSERHFLPGKTEGGVAVKNLILGG